MDCWPISSFCRCSPSARELCFRVAGYPLFWSWSGNHLTLRVSLLHMIDVFRMIPVMCYQGSIINCSSGVLGNACGSNFEAWSQSVFRLVPVLALRRLSQLWPSLSSLWVFAWLLLHGSVRMPEMCRIWVWQLALLGACHDNLLVIKKRSFTSKVRSQRSLPSELPIKPVKKMQNSRKAFLQKAFL